MKHYKTMMFMEISECQTTLHKCKALYIKPRPPTTSQMQRPP